MGMEEWPTGHEEVRGMEHGGPEPEVRTRLGDASIPEEDTSNPFRPAI